MRRFFFGFLWFLVFNFGGLAIGGAIVGASAGQHAAETNVNRPKNFSQGYAVGYDAGQVAGEEFGHKYWGIFLLGSLILAVGGSVLGILPGTKRKEPKEPTGV